MVKRQKVKDRIYLFILISYPLPQSHRQNIELKKTTHLLFVSAPFEGLLLFLL